MWDESFGINMYSIAYIAEKERKKIKKNSSFFNPAYCCFFFASSRYTEDFDMEKDKKDSEKIAPLPRKYSIAYTKQNATKIEKRKRLPKRV